MGGERYTYKLLTVEQFIGHELASADGTGALDRL